LRGNFGKSKTVPDCFFEWLTLLLYKVASVTNLGVLANKLCLYIPAKMDGGPHQVIEPGSTWQPFFEIKQLAATLWYHSHLEGKTAEHVYKGLAGLFIVDDAKSDQLSTLSRR
jgi:FtsP/CotA-like multicopper oxidase with cupredoxin domain